MKVMKKAEAMKAMKVSMVARGKLARSAVLKGKKTKTVSGLTAASLMKNKRGKVVSKSASARAKKSYATSALKRWADAVKQARKELKITGFCPTGGSTQEGKRLYSMVKTVLATK